MTDTLIACENISKTFCRDLKKSLKYGLVDSLKAVFGGSHPTKNLRPGEFWALEDVSFELRRGESLGLVGHNGAGKTTLLKILSGIIKPNHGAVKLHGSLNALIALGAGFNPILTGRENVFINGLIRGASKRQVQSKLEEIVDFAGLQDAIDAPVRTYSSGMQARLGFAVAALLEKPDILLIDEVLAVGDMAFRSKCYRLIAEISRETGIVLVSHNSHSLESVCQNGLLLDRGKVVSYGAMSGIISHYETSRQADLDRHSGHYVSTTKSNDTGVIIEEIRLLDRSNQITPNLSTGESGAFEITISSLTRRDNVGFSLIIRHLDVSEPGIITLQSEKDERLYTVYPGRTTMRLRLPTTCFKPGSYTAKIYVSEPNLFILDAVESLAFRVSPSAECNNSSFFQPREWELIS